ncbi:MAG: hypothetical protein Ta2G_17120 [Termitinemataceae bacterium]|nr:MAG: hypothetical protein Ta2G_17120 [Termitinemataceae bacterium]
MKSQKTYIILLAAVLVAGVLGAGCRGADAIGEGGDPVGPGRNPTITKGVYVNFSGEGGTPGSQIFNLVYEEIPTVTFGAAYTDEAAFFEAKGITSYDYVNDPQGFALEEPPAFTVTGSALRYTIDEIAKLVHPDRSDAGYEFIGWAIKTVDETRLGSILSADATVEDPAMFSFLINTEDGTLATKTSGTSYITFKAKYRLDHTMSEKTDSLHDVISEILENGNTEGAAYDDEFLLGSGSISDTPERAAKYNELQEAIEEANSLLEGTLQDVTTTLDAYVMDDSGEIAQPPTQITETSSYRVYNIAAIEAVKARLDGFAADPDYHFENFAPKSAVIPADKKMHSVTITEAGIYEIDIYGASGGHVTTLSGNTTFGGKGGHVKGRVSLAAGSVLKFEVGTAGLGTAEYDSENNSFREVTVGAFGTGKPAGWPNGGIGGNGRSNRGGSGGGGSTNVYLLTGNAIGNKGVYSRDNADPELTDRIVVAGGGGGAAQSAWVNTNVQTFASLRGGNAGEQAIIKGCPEGQTASTNSSGDQFMFTVHAADGNNYYYGLYWDGTLNADGKGSVGTSSNSGNGTEGRGGGGGGYLGGITPTIQNQANTGSGGGGTNYIVGTATNPTNELSDYYGNGKATIKYISSN